MVTGTDQPAYPTPGFGRSAASLARYRAEIDQLQCARSYLQGALLCRYDHPATDCKVMGYEIDRRLALVD